MTMAAQDQWLAENTIKCPLGRVTKKDCDLLRARPTIAEALSGHGGKPGEQERHAKPGACAVCLGWNHWKQEAERYGDAKQVTLPRPQHTEISMADATQKVKRCGKCGKELPATVEFFYAHKSTLDGLEGDCKPCRRERKRAKRHNGETASRATVASPAQPRSNMGLEPRARIEALISDLQQEARAEGYREGYAAALAAITRAVSSATPPTFSPRLSEGDQEVFA